MLCDECGVRPANFLLKTVSEQGVTERNLCPVCMAKYQRKIPGLDLGNLAGLISGILNSRKEEKEETADTSYDFLRCPRCGTSFADYRSGGRLGCAECYKAFRVPLEEKLIKLNPELRHVGRSPQGLNNDAALRHRIELKRRLLVQAIAQEEYEQAARIRDEIREMTNTLSEGAVV